MVHFRPFLFLFAIFLSLSSLQSQILVEERVPSPFPEVGVICTSSERIISANPLQEFCYNPLNQPKPIPLLDEKAKCLKLSKDQRYIAVASHAISIVDLEKGMNIRQLVGHDNWITGICEHRFNSYVWATVSADLTVRTWDIRMHPSQTSCRRAMKRFNCLQFSPDCGFLACGGDNISVFDLQNPTNISLIASPSKVLDLSFHPEEYLMASTSEDRIVRYWDLESRECVSQSHPFESPVRRILFEPQGRYLVAASAKNLTATKWEPFDIIGQVGLPSTSAADTNPLSARLSSGGEGLVTFDLCEHNGYVLHLGVSASDGTLSLASVSLNRLEMPLVKTHATPTKSSTASSGATIPPAPFRSPNVTPIFASPNRAISVEDLDLSMTNLNTDSEPTTPYDEAYPPYPSRPTSSGSDYTGQDAKDVDGRDLDPANFVWTSPPVNDGFKIVKKPAGSGQGAPGTGTSFKKREGTPTSLTPTHTSMAAMKSARSRSTSTSNLHGKDETKPGFRAPSLSRPNLSDSKPTLAPSKSTSTLVSNKSSRRSEPAKLSKPPIPSQGGPKSRVAPTEKQKVARMSSQSSQEQAKTTPSAKNESSEMIGELFSGHSKIMGLLARRKTNIKKVVAAIKAKKREDEILDEAASQDEPHVLATLLARYKDQPSAYSLNFAASVLPKLRNILQYPNSEYTDLSLHTLEVLCQNFGDTIRKGATANANAIGVDIAAEQRQERCVRCRKALMDLHLNSAFIIDRMNADQQLKFNVLLPKLEEITS